jgi:rhodanese-related sulfurtransferase
MPDTIEVSPKAANDALQAGGAVLVDVREQSEYDQVHIPGSILIPLAELPSRMSEIPTDQDVYVHCRMGGRSARAVEMLRAFGRSNSYNVSGGIEAWEDEGLPVAH